MQTIYACFIGYIVQAIVNNFVPLLFVTFQNSTISYWRGGCLDEYRRNIVQYLQNTKGIMRLNGHG